MALEMTMIAAARNDSRSPRSVTTRSPPGSSGRFAPREWGGTLEASLTLKGKLAAPVYAGEAHLRKGELSLHGLALPISEADIDVAVGGDEIRVLRANARFGGGSLTLSGHAPIHGFKIGDSVKLVPEPVGKKLCRYVPIGKCVSRNRAGT